MKDESTGEEVVQLCVNLVLFLRNFLHALLTSS